MVYYLKINKKETNMSLKVKVIGTVTTMRGSTDINGRKEEFAATYEVKTEQEASEAWKKEVSSDSTNMDWKILSVEVVSE